MEIVSPRLNQAIGKTIFQIFNNFNDHGYPQSVNYLTDLPCPSLLLFVSQICNFLQILCNLCAVNIDLSIYLCPYVNRYSLELHSKKAFYLFYCCCHIILDSTVFIFVYPPCSRQEHNNYHSPSFRCALC